MTITRWRSLTGKQGRSNIMQAYDGYIYMYIMYIENAVGYRGVKKHCRKHNPGNRHVVAEQIFIKRKGKKSTDNYMFV